MNEVRAKINESGRVIIPASYRHALQLEAGDEILLRLEGKTLRLTSLKYELKKIRAEVKRCAKGKSLVQELLSMRKEEASRE